jgi:hypothetical protein
VEEGVLFSGANFAGDVLNRAEGKRTMGIDADKFGSLQLLMGNEAIARGAIEAGIGVATAYPGTPSSEVIATLAKVAKKMNLYVEWSINEKLSKEFAPPPLGCESDYGHETEWAECGA